VTNFDRDDRRVEAASAGAQIDFRFTLLSHMDMTLSAGYGAAFREGSLPKDEIMISVKVL